MRSFIADFLTIIVMTITAVIASLTFSILVLSNMLNYPILWAIGKLNGTQDISQKT